jgi:hypothetical protein
MSDIFMQVTSKCLEELCFSLHCSRHTDFLHYHQTFPWDLVVQTLARPQFVNVKRLKIRLWDDIRLAEAAWIIREKYLHAFNHILFFESFDLGPGNCQWAL